MKKTGRILTLKGTVTPATIGATTPVGDIYWVNIFEDDRKNYGWVIRDIRPMTPNVSYNNHVPYSFGLFTTDAGLMSTARIARLAGSESFWANENEFIGMVGSTVGGGGVTLGRVSPYVAFENDHVIVRTLSIAANSRYGATAYLIILEEVKLNDKEEVVQLIKEKAQNV